MRRNSGTWGEVPRSHNNWRFEGYAQEEILEEHPFFKGEEPFFSAYEWEAFSRQESPKDWSAQAWSPEEEDWQDRGLYEWEGKNCE
ncbi:MAG: hypothetical protein GX786_01490 [Clostridiales bacterium]|nr:hypothetical protein [Clostridiales bacterium]